MNDSPLRILMLEDSPLDAELTLANLQDAGIEPASVERVETRDAFAAALERVAAGAFDLILADYALPTFDGISALRMAQARCPEVPFLFVSGTLGEDIAVDMLHQGATDYVLKQKPGRLGPAVRRAAAAARDRRNRHAAESALRRNEQLLQSITQSLTSAIFILDVEWHGGGDEPTLRYAAANPAYERLIGRRADDLLGRGPDDVLPMAEATVFTAQAVACAKSGEPRTDEVRLPSSAQCDPHNQSGISWWLTNLTPFRDAAGRVVRIVGASLCLDDQKSAEQQLRDQEERLRIALATGGMGTWDWQMQTGDLHWSDAVYRLLGRPPHSFKPSYDRFLACVDLRDREMVEQTVRDCAARHQEFRSEFRVVWPDGSEHWLSTRGTFHYDELGRPSRMVGVAIDATDRRQREAALRQAKDEAEAANAAKDQFLAALSHELRTPLTPVLATVTALEADPRLPAEFREDMEILRRNVELEARLIDDLLDLTRITKGKLALFLDTVDVHAVLRHTIDICQSDIRGKRIAFTADLAAQNPFVRADSARVQQIFWNLLKNAVKFTPERGTITLRTRDDVDGRVAVEVRDSGIGIEPAALPRLFRPFEQGSGAIPHRFGGLGLGLAIARALVEQHHGTISARSEGLGHGATFAVTLPMAERVPAPARPPRDGHPANTARQAPVAGNGLRRPRILLVEDHADTARIMTRLLQKQGFDLATVGNVNDAVALATSERFDLLISDIGLPDGTGIDLMRQLRTLPYTPRAIALTGFGMEDDVRKTLEAGFERHLTKPVNFQQLQTIITQMATPVAAS